MLPTPTITHKTQLEPALKWPKSNPIITNGKPTKPKLNSRPFNNHYKNNKSVTKLEKARRWLRAKRANAAENARVHSWEVRNYYVGLLVGQMWKKNCGFKEGNWRWKVGIIILIMMGNWQKKRKRSKRVGSAHGTEFPLQLLQGIWMRCECREIHHLFPSPFSPCSFVLWLILTLELWARFLTILNICRPIEILFIFGIVIISFEKVRIIITLNIIKNHT